MSELMPIFPSEGRERGSEAPKEPKTMRMTMREEERDDLLSDQEEGGFTQ
jgi:hypothetical protein